MDGGIFGKSTSRWQWMGENVPRGHLQNELNVWCALQSGCLLEPQWGILCHFAGFGIFENLRKDGLRHVQWRTAMVVSVVSEASHLPPCGPGGNVYSWVLWHLLQPNDVWLPDGWGHRWQDIQVVRTSRLSRRVNIRVVSARTLDRYLVSAYSAFSKAGLLGWEKAFGVI